MAEEDLAPGKSSVAVNNCIRQLSYCKNDIRDTVGIWGEVRMGWTSAIRTSLLYRKTSWKNFSVGKYVHAMCSRLPCPIDTARKYKRVQGKCWQSCSKPFRTAGATKTSYLCLHLYWYTPVQQCWNKLLKSVEVFLLTKGLRVMLWDRECPIYLK